jgi:hypothetical protein
MALILDPQIVKKKNTSFTGQQYMGTNNEKEDEPAHSNKSRNKSGHYRIVRTNPKKSKDTGKVLFEVQDFTFFFKIMDSLYPASSTPG